MMEEGHCVATIHAEANAIIQAAKNGVNIDGATNYVTASPCWSCFKQLANAGIVRICYGTRTWLISHRERSSAIVVDHRHLIVSECSVVMPHLSNCVRRKLAVIS
jgi:deoxycytidylate deaminase